MVGDNDDDMLLAAESLRECGGGFCVVSHGIVLARLPLPIAGLMTDAPVDSVLEIQRALLDAAAYIGVDKKSDPLVALSFLALPVIPAIRNAIYNATGVAINTIPITPHVLFAEFSRAGLIKDEWTKEEK